MATLAVYDINAYATQISKEFYIDESDHETDKSYILQDEMDLFAIDMKNRVKFISRTKP
jgi:hypothetical protein